MDWSRRCGRAHGRRRRGSCLRSERPDAERRQLSSLARHRHECQGLDLSRCGRCSSSQLHHHLRRCVHAAHEHALDALDVEERCRHDDLRDEPLQALLRGLEDDVLPQQQGQLYVTRSDEARLAVFATHGSLPIRRTFSRLSFFVSWGSFIRKVSLLRA